MRDWHGQRVRGRGVGRAFGKVQNEKHMTHPSLEVENLPDPPSEKMHYGETPLHGHPDITDSFLCHDKAHIFL